MVLCACDSSRNQVESFSKRMLSNQAWFSSTSSHSIPRHCTSKFNATLACQIKAQQLELTMQCTGQLAWKCDVDGATFQAAD